MCICTSLYIPIKNIDLDDVGEVEKKYEPVLLGKNDVNISSKGESIYGFLSTTQQLIHTNQNHATISSN